jgi:hypothetical protein
LEAITAKPQLPRKRHRRRGLILFFVGMLLLGLTIFVAASKNPFAQGIQDLAGWKHDQTIVDASFSVGPHTFRYYKFSLPQDSASVAIVGQFRAESQTIGKRNDGNPSTPDPHSDDRSDNHKDGAGDTGIEVYVQTESAFTSWQNRRATRSLYDSALVPSGSVRADMPAGAGVYYLVFSNKAATKMAKAVHATVLLRYRSWLRRALTRHN